MNAVSLRCILFWVLLLPVFAGAAAAAAGPAAAQNPFGLDPKGAPAKPGAAPAAKAPPPPLFRPPAAVQRFVAAIARWQRRLNDELARQVAAYKSGGAVAPVLAILLLSFLYGLFHAAGPGHGKFVVAAYFLAHRARPRVHARRNRYRRTRASRIVRAPSRKANGRTRVSGCTSPRVSRRRSSTPTASTR